MTYDGIIEQVSRDLGIPPNIIRATYRAYWGFIKNTIQELPLKDDLSEEEFLKIRPNFNIPSLGKLGVSYSRYLGVKEKFNHIRKLRENNEKAD